MFAVGTAAQRWHLTAFFAGGADFARGPPVTRAIFTIFGQFHRNEKLINIIEGTLSNQSTIAYSAMFYYGSDT